MNDTMKHIMTGIGGVAAGGLAYLGTAMGCTNVPTSGGQWAAVVGTALLALVAGQLGLHATPPGGGK